MKVAEIAGIVGEGIEAIAVAVVVIGVAAALTRFALNRSYEVEENYKQLRRNLGRAILIGLELFVAADIIETVAIEPTLEKVYLLGMIVLIRTFLSFSLETEIKGHFPWQRERLRE